MLGLGKRRSKLGKFIDRQGIKQHALEKASGVGSETMTKLCSDDKVKPQIRTISKILAGLKKITGQEYSSTDFWA